MPNTPAPARSVAPARLFWMILTIAGAGLLLSFPIERSTFFRACCETDWLRSNEAAFRIRNANCEVVLYGDSMAVVGLDTQMIEEATRLRTCNIAQSGGVTRVLGLDPLDRFLSNNRKPRFLMMLFHPGNYRIPRSSGNDMLGFIALVKFYPPWRITLAAVRYPDVLPGLMYNVFNRGSWHGLQRTAGLDKKLRNGEADDGYLSMRRPPLQKCIPESDTSIALPDPTWLKSLRARYRASADHLLLNISPGGSACHPPGAQMGTLTAGLTDNRYEVLPPSFFVDEFDHPSASGRERISTEAANQIGEILKQTESGHGAL